MVLAFIHCIISGGRISHQAVLALHEFEQDGSPIKAAVGKPVECWFCFDMFHGQRVHGLERCKLLARTLEVKTYPSSPDPHGPVNGGRHQVIAFHATYLLVGRGCTIAVDQKGGPSVQRVSVGVLVNILGCDAAQVPRLTAGSLVSSARRLPGVRLTACFKVSFRASSCPVARSFTS